MSLQLDDSFIIADRIREKVEEYIEENKVLDNKTFIWIDCNSLEVYLSNTDEEYSAIFYVNLLISVVLYLVG